MQPKQGSSGYGSKYPEQHPATSPARTGHLRPLQCLSCAHAQPRAYACTIRSEHGRRSSHAQPRCFPSAVWPEDFNGHPTATLSASAALVNFAESMVRTIEGEVHAPLTAVPGEFTERQSRWVSPGPSPGRFAACHDALSSERQEVWCDPPSPSSVAQATALCITQFCLEWCLLLGAASCSMTFKLC